MSRRRVIFTSFVSRGERARPPRRGRLLPHISWTPPRRNSTAHHPPSYTLSRYTPAARSRGFDFLLPILKSTSPYRLANPVGLNRSKMSTPHHAGQIPNLANPGPVDDGGYPSANAPCSSPRPEMSGQVANPRLNPPPRGLVSKSPCTLDSRPPPPKPGALPKPNQRLLSNPQRIDVDDEDHDLYAADYDPADARILTARERLIQNTRRKRDSVDSGHKPQTLIDEEDPSTLKKNRRRGYADSLTRLTQPKPATKTPGAPTSALPGLTLRKSNS